MKPIRIRDRKVKNQRPTGRISPEAKRLLKVTLRRQGSLRKAAQVLRLPSHAQIPAMLEGRIGETTAMKAALKRASARAQAAFYMERPEVCLIDREEFKKQVRELHERIEVLENML